MGLIKKRSTYYFRGHIPKKLRGIINQATIDKSLKTKNKKVALQVIKQFELQFKYFIKELEIALTNKDDLHAFLDNYLNDYLQETEKNLFDTPFTIIYEQIERGYFAERIEYYQYMIYHSDFRSADGITKDALGNFTSPLDDEDILDASQYMVKRLLQQTEYVRQRAIDGYYDVSEPSTNSYFKTSKKEQIGEITQPRKKQTQQNLKAYTEEYINDMKTERHWTKSSISGHKNAMNSLLYEFGDIDINSLTKDDLNEYKNKLQKLPRRWDYPLNKYFNKCTTLNEVTEKNELIKAGTISLSTVAKYISKIRAFFDYCHDKGKIETNIAEKLKVFIPKADKNRAARKPYSMQDLNTLFSVPFYTTQLEKNIVDKIEKVLIPIISLYSGMRLNEISSLYIDDIQQEDGIYYFDINDDNDKTTKNEGSNRRVPIHPKIIEAGFLDFYNDFKSKNSGRLWSSLTKQEKYDDSVGNDEGIYGKKISSWYGRINRKYVTKDRKKVFHSFRHNAINNLKQQDESKDIIRQLVGHDNNKDKDMTFGTYGEDYSLETVQRVANKIHYNVPALDLVIEKIGAHIRQKEV